MQQKMKQRPVQNRRNTNTEQTEQATQTKKLNSEEMILLAELKTQRERIFKKYKKLLNEHRATLKELRTSEQPMIEITNQIYDVKKKYCIPQLSVNKELLNSVPELIALEEQKQKLLPEYLIICAKERESRETFNTAAMDLIEQRMKLDAQIKQLTGD